MQKQHKMNAKNDILFNILAANEAKKLLAIMYGCMKFSLPDSIKTSVIKVSFNVE